MKHIFSASLMLLFAIVARGQDVQQAQTSAFNLQECLNYAYEHQDSLKNAKLDIESANYRVKETIGLGLPQVSGTASLQDFIKLPTSLLPGEFFGQPGTFIPVTFGVKYQSNLGLNVSQIIFDGSYLVGLQASKTYKELSQRSYNRTKVSTTVSVTKAYYQVLVSAEQLKLLDANISQLKQQLTETTEQNKQGFVEKIDVDRLTVQYNNLTTTRDNTVRMLALGYQLLKFQIGMPVSDNLIVKEKIADITLEDVQLSSYSDTTAYKSRVEYGLLEVQKKLYELDLKRYKSQYLPALSATGSTSLSYQNNSFGDLYSRNFPTTVVGLQLNIPIFSGFQRLNQVRQAQIVVEKSANVLNLVKNGINLQMDQARINYTNSTESLNNQRQNMALADEVLRVSKIKYEQGVGSNIEVTQAQTSLEQAQNNYIQSLYNTLVSRVDLDAAYGRIK